MKSFSKTPVIQALIVASAIFGFAHSAAQVPSVSFAEPKANATVRSPVKVKFNLSGMEIGPIGDMDAKKGHHHLIIDGEPIEEGQSVPVDEKHIHYGKGQTEAEISLPEGKHTLTLQFANGAHQSYGKKMSASMVIHVKGADKVSGY